MEWQGGNKQRPNYWQRRRSFILGDSNWKSFQVGYPVDMYLRTNWILSDLWSILFYFYFCKCFEQSTSWCFGSHFFVARSHRFRHCHLPLSFSGFFLCFFFLRKSMERKLLCQLFTATNCSTLAQHALKLICQTTFDSILFQVVTEPVVLLWRHGGNVTETRDFSLSCRRRKYSKRRVCFHSNQYFYSPQENANLSNEQRVC